MVFDKLWQMYQELVDFGEKAKRQQCVLSNHLGGVAHDLMRFYSLGNV